MPSFRITPCSCGTCLMQEEVIIRTPRRGNWEEWKFGIGTNTTSYHASGATTNIQLSEPGT
ncbi:hypothetical protein ACPDHL_09535 [Myroides sp. C15-4]|uniref:hypothetical protein n=1 Tax=Myroides sp. C15-4 TaxID=3400532 RepID=UPI003D2F72AF